MPGHGPTRARCTHRQWTPPAVSFAEDLLVKASELGTEAYALVVVCIWAAMGLLIFAKMKPVAGDGARRRCFTAGARILSSFAIPIAVTTAIAAMVIIRLADVREQMETVAELNVMAVDTAILLNGEQREQDILLERILRYRATGGSQEKLSEATNQFHQKSTIVKAAISEDLAHLSQLRARGEGDAELVRQTIRELEGIAGQREEYETKAMELFSSLVAEDSAAGEAAVAAEAIALNRLLRDHLLGVEDRAQRAIALSRRDADEALWLMIVLAATAVALSLLAGWLCANSISSGLRGIMTAAARLRQGDLAAMPSRHKRGDECEVLATSLEDLRSQLGLLAGQAEELAAGHCDTEIVLQRVRAGVTLAEAAAQVAEENQLVGGELAASFNKMSASMHEIAAQAAMMAGGDTDGGVADSTADSADAPETNGDPGAAMTEIARKMRNLTNALEAQSEATERTRRQMAQMAADVVSAESGVIGSSADLTMRAEAAMQNGDGQRQAAAGAAAAADEMSVDLHDAAEKAEALVAVVDEVGSALDAVSKSITSIAESAQRTGEVVSTNFESIDDLPAAAARDVEGLETVERAARQIGDDAREGVRVAGVSASGMERIASRVAEAAAAVHELGEGTDPIRPIAATLADVSDQAKLLSLNASIEAARWNQAARSGDVGRGLEVVAAEAGRLSGRIASAVTELEKIVGAVRANASTATETVEQSLVEVREGVKSALRSGEVGEQIRQAADTVTELIGKSKTATDHRVESNDRIVTSAVETNQLWQRLVTTIDQGSRLEELAKRAVAQMERGASELATTARAQAEASEQLAGATEDVRRRCEQTTSAIEQVVGSSEELSHQTQALKRSAASELGRRNAGAEGNAKAGDGGVLKTVAEN